MESQENDDDDYVEVDGEDPYSSLPTDYDDCIYMPYLELES